MLIEGKVKQYVYPASLGGNNTIEVGTEINFDSLAYRIAFQALPGTKFKCLGENTGLEIDTNQLITMGPTGIYELGFTEPLIGGFYVDSVINENSVMILDVFEGSYNNIISPSITQPQETDENTLTQIVFFGDHG